MNEKHLEEVTNKILNNSDGREDLREALERGGNL